MPPETPSDNPFKHHYPTMGMGKDHSIFERADEMRLRDYFYVTLIGVGAFVAVPFILVWMLLSDVAKRCGIMYK